MLACQKAGEDMSEMQTIIAGIWNAVLEQSVEDRESNFFELGGDSLQMMNMLSEIESELGLDITPGEFFDNPTLGGFSDYVERVSQQTVAKSA